MQADDILNIREDTIVFFKFIKTKTVKTNKIPTVINAHLYLFLGLYLCVENAKLIV